MRGPQFPKNEPYLVTNGTDVEIATHRYERVVGYQWWSRSDVQLVNITHYAEINLPLKE